MRKADLVAAISEKTRVPKVVRARGARHFLHRHPPLHRPLPGFLETSLSVSCWVGIALYLHRRARRLVPPCGPVAQVPCRRSEDELVSRTRRHRPHLAGSPHGIPQSQARHQDTLEGGRLIPARNAQPPPVLSALGLTAPGPSRPRGRSPKVSVPQGTCPLPSRSGRIFATT